MLNRRFSSLPGFLVALSTLPATVLAAESFPLDIAPDKALIIETTYDASRREVYAATTRSLYLFRRDGDKKAVNVFTGEAETRLVLAPGGVLFGLLAPGQESPGPFSAHLHSIGEAPAINLAVAGGVSDLILGTRGNLVVTLTRLQPLEASAKGFRYTFFEADGKPVETQEIEGPRNRYLDPEGNAVLFAGKDDASVYASDGKKEGDWKAQGVYLPAALGPGADTVVLVRTDGAVRELVLQRPSGSATLPLAAPVEHLRLAADASFALVVFADASYAFLDVAGPALSEPRRLPLDNVYRITDAEVIDRGTLAFGVLHGTSSSLEEKGTILAVDRSDGKKILFEERLPLKSPTAYLPAVDPAPGTRAFVGRTDLRSIFIGLED